jgi:hypothetical protein
MRNAKNIKLSIRQFWEPLRLNVREFVHKVVENCEVKDLMQLKKRNPAYPLHSPCSKYARPTRSHIQIYFQITYHITYVAMVRAT